MDYTSLIKKSLPLFTIAGQLISLGLFAFLASKKIRTKLFYLWNNLKKNSIFYSLLVVLIAMLGSLFYSEVIGYEPCKLCWVQRIFIYPQVFLLAIALWRREKNIFNYLIPFSGLGLLISGYHYLLQIGLLPQPPCSTVGFSVSCSQNFFMYFGYITIPMMAMVVFVLVILFGLISLRSN
ncbi:MAG: disulfide bond formation protein B [Candidatus Magasanikbacteria bacterium]